MKVWLGLLLLLTGILCGQNVDLQVVQQEGFNQLAITAEVLGLSDEGTSDVTGSFNVALNIDPTTGTTNELSFIDGVIAGTDATFNFNTLIGSGGFTIRDLIGSIQTLFPPGLVVPETGEFAANQHEFFINDGQIVGSGLLQGQVFDLEEDPAGGTLDGTGTVSLTSVAGGFDVIVILPVDVTETFAVEVPSLGTIDVDVRVEGILRLEGFAAVEEVDPYQLWAETNGVEYQDELDFSLSTGLRNRLVFALGYDAANVPQTPFTENEGIWSLDLTQVQVREAVEIQFGTSLESWGVLPTGQVVEGASVINPGFSGMVSWQQSGSQGFFRVIRREDP